MITAPQDIVATHSGQPVIVRPLNELLASLPAKTFDRLGRWLTPKSLPIKHVLHRQGDTINDVFFPGHGSCSLVKTMKDGTSAEIAIIGKEGVVGTSVFFGDRQAFGDAVMQIGDADGFSMPVEAFLAEMDRGDAFYTRVIRHYQALITQIVQTMACNGLHTMQQRCCRWLLTARDQFGSDQLRVTHEVLASMLGARRSTITLLLSELQKAGLLSRGRGILNILDRKGLEAGRVNVFETT